MNTATILGIVQITNALLGLFRNMNMSLTAVSEQIRKAEEEGRPFDLDDVEKIKRSSDAARDELAQAIEEAKRQGR